MIINAPRVLPLLIHNALLGSLNFVLGYLKQYDCLDVFFKLGSFSERFHYFTDKIEHVSIFLSS